MRGVVAVLGMMTRGYLAAVLAAPVIVGLAIDGFAAKLTIVSVALVAVLLLLLWLISAASARGAIGRLRTVLVAELIVLAFLGLVGATSDLVAIFR
ncbi:MAG: hypothetical protein WD533_02550 [Dehalococcoidia bacterium]